MTGGLGFATRRDLHGNVCLAMFPHSFGHNSLNQEGSENTFLQVLLAVAGSLQGLTSETSVLPMVGGG